MTQNRTIMQCAIQQNNIYMCRRHQGVLWIFGFNKIHELSVFYSLRGKAANFKDETRIRHCMKKITSIKMLSTKLARTQNHIFVTLAILVKYQYHFFFLIVDEKDDSDESMEWRKKMAF